jgi:hypothetical protein
MANQEFSLTKSQSEVFKYDDTDYFSPEYITHVYNAGIDENFSKNFLKNIYRNRYIFVKNHAWNLKSRKLSGFGFNTSKAYENYDNCESVIVDFYIINNTYIINGYVYISDIYKEITDKNSGIFNNFKKKLYISNDDDDRGHVFKSLLDLYILNIDKEKKIFPEPKYDYIKYINKKEFTHEDMSELFLQIE